MKRSRGFCPPRRKMSPPRQRPVNFRHSSAPFCVRKRSLWTFSFFFLSSSPFFLIKKVRRRIIEPSHHITPLHLFFSYFSCACVRAGRDLRTCAMRGGMVSCGSFFCSSLACFFFVVIVRVRHVCALSCCHIFIYIYISQHLILKRTGHFFFFEDP